MRHRLQARPTRLFHRLLHYVSLIVQVGWRQHHFRRIDIIVYYNFNDSTPSIVFILKNVVMVFNFYEKLFRDMVTDNYALTFVHNRKVS